MGKIQKMPFEFNSGAIASIGIAPNEGRLVSD